MRSSSRGSLRLITRPVLQLTHRWISRLKKTWLQIQYRFLACHIRGRRDSSASRSNLCRKECFNMDDLPGIRRLIEVNRILQTCPAWRHSLGMVTRPKLLIRLMIRRRTSARSSAPQSHQRYNRIRKKVKLQERKTRQKRKTRMKLSRI